MLPNVVATRFAKVMGSGRTQPCLLVCENAEGEEMELVVKLRGHPHVPSGGLLAEAFAALLAQDLDLPVQPPHRVLIDADFAAAMPEIPLREVFGRSVGLNFGSAKWQPGFTSWPRNKLPSRDMQQLAMEVFAFDGLIQNPDRRAANPNCAFLGDDLLLFDHESAFSHFRDILPRPAWEPGGLDFLKDHVFRLALRGQGLVLNRLRGALEAIDAARISEYLAAIPVEWGGQVVTGEGIRAHLLDCVAHFERIQLQLEASL